MHRTATSVYNTTVNTKLKQIQIKNSNIQLFCAHFFRTAMMNLFRKIFPYYATNVKSTHIKYMWTLDEKKNIYIYRYVYLITLHTCKYGVYVLQLCTYVVMSS